MQVNGMGMQNMHQNRYGLLNGGNRDMKNIMQSLSSEDREMIKTELQSLSKEDRQSLVSQITQLDYANMDSSQLTASIMEILGENTQTDSSSVSDDESNFSTYA
ncbi:hypothetical protein [Nitrosophilus alvini]|uniref:hypothetical protein n=1 Tax=Nitrosophilus alvini TaxID=2714855 RepID=UPI00190C5CD8|nr:hypothetical protein [Nitrosophilus alvini]